MEDLHHRWSHRWASPKVECRSSGIEGIGLFAIKKIKKGEIVFVMGGVIVPVSENDEYEKKLGDLGEQVNEHFVIAPTSREEAKRIGAVNHSCDPNTGFIDSISLAAIRDIKKGEEITHDYAFSVTISRNPNGVILKCGCGSKNCRKVIRVDDWKRKDLQKKYGQYFSPFLKTKIKTKNK